MDSLENCCWAFENLVHTVYSIVFFWSMILAYNYVVVISLCPSSFLVVQRSISSVNIKIAKAFIYLQTSYLPN